LARHLGLMLSNWHETICARRSRRIPMLQLPLERFSRAKNKFYHALFCCKSHLAWPYNFNYWTGGSRVDLPTAPKWCSLQKTISLSNITLVGQRNVSYEGEDCVAFQLTKVTNNITSNFSSFMTMRNCSARQMIACRVRKYN
jgi:hypothetical protein